MTWRAPKKDWWVTIVVTHTLMSPLNLDEKTMCRHIFMLMTLLRFHLHAWIDRVGGTIGEKP